MKLKFDVYLKNKGYPVHVEELEIKEDYIDQTNLKTIHEYLEMRFDDIDFVLYFSETFEPRTDNQLYYGNIAKTTSAHEIWISYYYAAYIKGKYGKKLSGSALMYRY